MNKVICSHCGGTNVLCEAKAMINVNTKRFDHYVCESLKNGRCQSCVKNVPLVDVYSNIATYCILWEAERKTPLADKPNCVSCSIIWKDSGDIEEVLIALNNQVDEEMDDKIFFYCDSVNAFTSLCDFSGEDFIIWSVQELIKI